ncbi:methyltransferase domain-containing protein [Variovorax paradoxus B4]|uniref:site-specific DNA-methyltransferase (adenine-specific) n=1 Tax=Variovorax paradoxus B4 TaxID=1246301 RepID=T1XGW3_VARPD|nr:type ISP restriction/modification enzyme [Variovorax paradoxus]AGU51808.1 methyltransferase domain-containing protein [Variovorax paradoxus B4]
MDFKTYLARVSSDLKAGNATEHTHRGALQNLIESAGDVVATNEPKRIACGAPDYIVSRQAQAGLVPIGYIEAKDVGKDLNAVEGDEQLQRYRSSLRNLVLTDYLEFRLYRSGELVQTTRAASWQKNGVLKSNAEGIAQTEALLAAFLASNLPSISSPRDLAKRMAQMARLIRDLIGKAFSQEEGKANGDLHTQYEGFRKVLLGDDLTPQQFADMYAQTICYGLFAARCNHDEGTLFTRQGAAYELPKTNPFLRRLFSNIAGADLDDRIAWAVDDLADLLAKADMSAVLADFGKATMQEDPVVHFYETFLAAYDPALRESRGVYYTPEPVVNYIVQSVDAVLKKDFALPKGLADNSKVVIKRTTGKLTPKGAVATEEVQTHRVQILDPAAGTGTFLFSVIQKIYESFKGNAGMWPGYVAEHLLPRIYGFELLMAPYAVAHMKLGLQLKNTGYDFATEERLRVYLTNTLEKAHELAGLPLFTQWLAEEAAQAGEVKQSAPIMVVLGNPPYSGHSVNKGAWIRGLVEDYKKSAVLKKPGQGKWLSDDYVKFIRFSQWRIDQTGYGILAFVTNHGYLDNPTFLDMRASLSHSFDDLYFLDLHGNTKKKEKAPDGSKDENVFDIQQGVSIAILVKRTKRSAKPIFRHAHLYGVRESKYEWLNSHDILNTDWTEIVPAAPANFFVPHNDEHKDEFAAFWSLPEIFNQNGDPAPGMVTTHDDFAISWTQPQAIEKVGRLLSTNNEEEARQIFKLCKQDQWNYADAKTELPKQDWKSQVKPVLYRPFDKRWTVYNSHVAVHRRERVMNHMLAGENLGLATVRQLANEPWEHVLAANTIIDDCYVSNRTKERGYLFPLYLFTINENASLLEEASLAGTTSCRANLAPEFLAGLEKNLGLTYIEHGTGDLASTFGPEDVYYYAYAVLYAPGYRLRYANQLKRDFARIPLISNVEIFKTFCRLGEKLAKLHLGIEEASWSSTYPVGGDNTVLNPRFTPIADDVTATGNISNEVVGRIFINGTQYFEAVAKAVWEYRVGSYQVAFKWLKDRKGHMLTFAELQAYQALLAALKLTIDIQNEIEETAPVWPLA